MLQDSGDARKPAIFLVMECFQNYIALQCAFIINSANYKTNKSKLKSWTDVCNIQEDLNTHFQGQNVPHDSVKCPPALNPNTPLNSAPSFF